MCVAPPRGVAEASLRCGATSLANNNMNVNHCHVLLLALVVVAAAGKGGEGRSAVHSGAGCWAYGAQVVGRRNIETSKVGGINFVRDIYSMASFDR